MDRLLIASSPVEIEAKAEEAGMPQAAHDLALALFHALTDRLGQAARLLPHMDPSWPSHHFYFGRSGHQELAWLLEGLLERPDFIEVADGVPSPSAAPSGLFVRQSREGFTGILVAHESHEGLPSPRPGGAS
jgi:hypothetical protein